jgi:uncharacterized protein YndB with AHSA1/START domain
VTAERATLRREVRVKAAPDEIWKILGDPARIVEWWPGIVDAKVDGDSRVITTGSGLPMPETILANDPLQHRFQYRITAPMFREHTSTLDVIDLGDGTSLVVYSVDADPSTMALVIAGAAGNALQHLRALVEGAP